MELLTVTAGKQFSVIALLHFTLFPKWKTDPVKKKAKANTIWVRGRRVGVGGVGVQIQEAGVLMGRAEAVLVVRSAGVDLT